MPNQVSNKSVPIVASLALSGQTDTIPLTTLYNPVNGLYRLSVYIVTTVAGTGGTAEFGLVWDDDDVTGQLNPNAMTLDLTQLEAGGGLPTTCYDVFTFRAINTNPIQYRVTVTGATGNPQYSIYAALERLA